MLTQKYKQQQQQVRVQTSESNYAKGMFFSDAPLAEGYSKVLVNWDIDANTGKLIPRKGLRSTKYTNIKPDYQLTQLFKYKTITQDNSNIEQPKENWTLKGVNNIIDSKVCAPYAEDSTAYTTNILQKTRLSVLYNNASKDVVLYNSTGNEYANATSFSIGTRRALPYTLNKPAIHNKDCYTNYFDKAIGTFAFDNNYYTFTVDFEKVTTFNFLGKANSTKLSTPLSIGNPGDFYTVAQIEYGGYNNTFNEGEKRTDNVCYFDTDGQCQTYYPPTGVSVDKYTALEKLPEGVYPSYKAAFLEHPPEVYKPVNPKLCYTKLGKDIQPDDILLDKNIDRNNLGPHVYYVCEINPQKLNPTEAASWGYNMLLEDPYKFNCEKTATNTITILGILPYDNSGQVTLTPRKNQEVTLKAYYRAPEKFYTDVAKGTYYATVKQYIEITTTDDTGLTSVTKRDPKTLDELETFCGKTEEKSADYSSYTFGNWWYCTDEKQYYMVVPGKDLKTKVLDKPSVTKPAASVLLKPAMDATTESSIRVRWQMRTVDSSDWIDIYNETIKLSEQNNQPFTVTTTMSSEELLIKFTISDPASPDELTEEETVLTTNTIGLSLVSDELAATLNLKPIKYDLSRCAGMCEWQQRLVIWGVQDALNTLFVSDINNPTFFPYPNNVDALPEAILAVYNYGEELLALTANALYRLTWDTEGTGWTHKLVQRNLQITEQDLPMCCVIKNMFFFKSGNYYYMLVPKVASGGVSGEVTIAPISRPIENLLDNFHNEIFNIVNAMSDDKHTRRYSDGTLQSSQFTDWLKYYYVYTDNTSVVLNYIYNITYLHKDIENIPSQPYEEYAFLNIQLRYNTESRIWSLYAFETPTIYKAFSDTDVLNQTTLLGVYYTHNTEAGDKYCIDISEAMFNGDTYNGKAHEDYEDIVMYYLIDNAGMQYDHTITYSSLLNNYQFLDTGNRDINTDMKKRFREFQFKMRNVNATSLGFHTSFLIDGSLRRDLQKYTPRYLTDPETGEMVIVIERTLDEASINYLSFVPAYKVTRVEYAVASTKMLQDDGELTPTTLAEYNDPDKWVIDQSAFPGRTFWKVRVSISGKGYTPRAQLLSTNLKYFEVFGHSWVYRTMHGR